METQTHDARADIEQLNAFLQDELAAVETYQQCLEKIDRPQIASGLTDLQRSHQKRATLLSHRVQELGGTPETSSGMWGSFSKLIEGGAQMFGEKPALSALEQGEARGEKNYQQRSDKLTPASQSFINTSILPEHQHSHETLDRLKSAIH